MIEVVVYMFLAIFIFVRLYNALGKEEFLNIEKISIDDPIDVQEESNDTYGDEYIDSKNLETIRSAETLIRKKCPDFLISDFIKRVSNAFESILAAFYAGDLEFLQLLSTDEMYKKFEREVNNRNELGHKAYNTLLALSSLKLCEIEFEGSTVNAIFQIQSEQINYVTDNALEVVTGSKTKSIIVSESWKFTKDLNANDLKWRLSKIF